MQLGEGESHSWAEGEREGGDVGWVMVGWVDGGGWELITHIKATANAWPSPLTQPGVVPREEKKNSAGFQGNA